MFVCMYILMSENYSTDNCISFKGRDVIPRELMQGAKGLAFITVISLAVLVSILHVWQYVCMYSIYVWMHTNASIFSNIA